MEQEPRSTTKTSDTLILIYLIYASATFLINFILYRLPESWMASTKYLSIGLSVIGGMTPILLALAIKNKTGKIIGIVLSSVFAVFNLYSTADWLFF